MTPPLATLGSPKKSPSDHTSHSASEAAPSASTADDISQSTGGRFSMLPRLAGKAYIPLGLLARVPVAMLIVGVLTLVTARSGSFAIGGFASGSVGIGAALGAPLGGYLADRWGQKPVLLTASVLNALALALVLTLTYTAGDFPAAATAGVLAAAFFSGATSPQVGPLSRVRWMALIQKQPVNKQSALTGTAMSLEGTADEITFVLGPALVGILASLVAPWLPLAIAGAMTLVLVSLFAVHPTHQLVSGRSLNSGVSHSPKEHVSWGKVAIPVTAMFCMGTFFGSSQTSLASFTGAHGSVDQSGLMYAIMGSSSAIAALSVAYWSPRFSFPARWVLTSALMVLGTAAFLLPQSMGAMAVVLLLVGIPVGPTMVTIFSVGGVVAPPQWMGTVMTALASGVLAGTALGSSIAGALAQNAGYHAAFGVPMAAAGALLVLGIIAATTLRGSAKKQARNN